MISRRNKLLVAIAAFVMASMLLIISVRRIFPLDGLNAKAGQAARKWVSSVVEKPALGLVPPCPDARTCADDYMRLPELAKTHERRIGKEGLDALIVQAKTGPVISSDIYTEEELRRRIVDSLNLGYLLDGFDRRPLRVDVISQTRSAAGTQEELVFHDPFVGRFSALYLEPPGAGRHPAVLALHGHGENATTFRDQHGGDQYPARGLAILIPTFRVHCADENEDRLARYLLTRGFPLMGLRVYESLLCLKYLATRPGVRPDAIGLIGHSGGSIVGGLVLRLTRLPRAFVWDSRGSFLGIQKGDMLLDEFVPALSPIQTQLTDLSRTTTATLRVPYGNVDTPEVFDFFRRTLQPDGHD